MINMCRRLWDAKFHGWVGKGFDDAVLKRGKWEAITGSSQPMDVRLGEMLIAIVQIIWERNIFDSGGSVHLDQGFTDSLECPSSSGAGVNDGLDRMPRAFRKQSAKKEIDAAKIPDKDEVASLFPITITA